MNCTFCSNPTLVNVPNEAVNLDLWKCFQCCVIHVFLVTYVAPYQKIGYIFCPDDFDYELNQMDDVDRTVILDRQGKVLFKVDHVIEGITPSNAKELMTRLLNLKAFQ